MKHTTPHGLTVTSKSEHNKGVNGALEAKFFHSKSGVSIDKAKVRGGGGGASCVRVFDLCSYWG